LKTTFCSLLISFFFLPAVLPADSVVMVGGSGPSYPPQFWENSFLAGLAGSWQEAHPFHAAPGGAWLPVELEIPLYHYDGMAGDRATFSIWTDDSGKPGSSIATFPVSNITTQQHVISVAPSFVSSPLQGGADYWIVGVNPGRGQVNWNMYAGTGNFTRAYRENGGSWVVQKHLANQSAFALLGSPVPEPSGLFLLGVGAAGLAVYLLPGRLRQRTHRS
jgi:hypothetical protein